MLCTSLTLSFEVTFLVVSKKAKVWTALPSHATDVGRDELGPLDN